MKILRRVLKILLGLTLAGLLLGLVAVGVVYWVFVPTLPTDEELHALRKVELQMPLQVFSEDDQLMAIFGEARRSPVDIKQVPEVVKKAFIATEDARFYEHPGVDWRGISRAVWLLATTDRKRVPGGSTITQQVARNFFLSTEYSYRRKMQEMLLALKMEQELSKDEILELYLNKIFFGNRSYGVAAAAEFYFGKTLSELTLDECATLAAIPKFPSSGNPLTNPERALERRNFILDRMFEEGFISQAERNAAVSAPAHAKAHEPEVALRAPYVAEMVRQSIMDQYGDSGMTSGYVVRSTIRSDSQKNAQQALRETLIDYDRRHGWRGAEAEQVDEDALKAKSVVGGLLPARVQSVTGKKARLLLASGENIDVDAPAYRGRYVSADRRTSRKPLNEMLTAGNLVRVAKTNDGSYQLSQIPKVQGALIALRPDDGRLLALEGGFDFDHNKFNRAMQANRQPGSSFKPFVYASSFERGYTPASIVLDAPVAFRQASGEMWRPQNSDGLFRGPMRLREAMVSSRNLVSVRLLDSVGINFARRYITDFGFPEDSLPPNLSLALGTASVTPMTLAKAYAVIANGGYAVEPYYIDSVQDRYGKTIFEANPARACLDCPERMKRRASGADLVDVEGFDLSSAPSPQAPSSQEPDVTASEAMMEVATGEGKSVHLAKQVADERDMFLMRSILKDVINRGTGKAAKVLKRQDIGGKTGTTNEYRDAWFSGFGPEVVTTVWVGMDDFTTLGKKEYGGKAALPAWIRFMRSQLNEVPNNEDLPPPGISTAQVDRTSGLRVSVGGVKEFFKTEDVASLETETATWEYNNTDEASFDIF